MKYVFTIFTLLLSSTFSYAFDFPESAFGVRFGSYQEDTDTPLLDIDPPKPIEGDSFRYHVWRTSITYLIYTITASTTYYMPLEVCKAKSDFYINNFSEFFGEGQYLDSKYYTTEYKWSLSKGSITIYCTEGVVYNEIGKFRLNITFTNYEYNKKDNNEDFFREYGYYPNDNDNDVKIDIFDF